MATRKIETEISLLGEAEFNRQMKLINNNLKNLDAEMKVVSTSFDENADSTEKLRAKQSLLNQQIDQQKEKVRALNEMYEKQKAELGEDAAATDKYRQAALKAEAALNKMQSELRQTNNQLEEASKETNKTGDEAQKAAPKIKLSAEAMEKMNAAAKKLGNSLGEAGKKIPAALLKGTWTGLKAFTISASAASVGIAALATVGFKQLTTFAIQAAQSGNPAFAGLAANLDELSKASELAKTALGKVLLPELESFTEAGAKLLRDFSDNMDKAGGDREKMGEAFAQTIRDAAAMLKIEAPAFIEAGGDLIRGLSEGLIENADQIGYDIGSVVQTLADSLSENADKIGQAAAVLVGTLGDALLSNAPQLFTAGVSMIENLVKGLDGRDLGKAAGELVMLIITTMLNLLPDLLQLGVDLVKGIIDGIVEAWPALKQAGADIIQQIWDGLKAAWDSVIQWFNGVVSKLQGTAHINIETHESSSSRQHGGHDGSFASGLDYVPYDNYRANLHEGELIAPKPLANALRAANLVPGSGFAGTSDAGGGQNVAVNISFRGSLAQLARVLQPEIDAVSRQQGTKLLV